MYRSEVTEGWIRDCQLRSRTLAEEVRRRKAAEAEIERLRAEIDRLEAQVKAGEVSVRRVA